MTRVSGLVMDGNQLKVVCESRRMHTQSACVVDWLRFTVYRQHCAVPTFLVGEGRTSASLTDQVSWWRELAGRGQDWAAVWPEAIAVAQAEAFAGRVCDALGHGFRVGLLNKGHDFYKHRFPILNDAGAECGSVLVWSSGSSARQEGQRETLNVNLHGSACAFASPGWERRMRELGESVQGMLTVVHLAVDYFHGLPGGLDGVLADYQAGGWDHLGRRPKVGDVNWLQGHSRSIYFGSKEAGKQTNVYEKGHQLFGHDEAQRLGISWDRIELRYGNKLRVLQWDMVTRPADFFAGASEAHLRYLRMAEAEMALRVPALPERVRVKQRAPLMSVQAEVARVCAWLRDTAGPSVGAALSFLNETHLAQLLPVGALPGRLKKFSAGQLREAFDSLAALDLAQPAPSAT